MLTYGPNKTKLQPSNRKAIEAMMKSYAEQIALRLAGRLAPVVDEVIQDQSRNNSVVRNQGS